MNISCENVTSSVLSDLYGNCVKISGNINNLPISRASRFIGTDEQTCGNPHQISDVSGLSGSLSDYFAAHCGVKPVNTFTVVNVRNSNLTFLGTRITYDGHYKCVFNENGCVVTYGNTGTVVSTYNSSTHTWS